MMSQEVLGTERRHAQRKRPGGISYFQFEAGSGGIVLDASERGLAFQAADAVQQLGPSRICISPDPERRIEVDGDIVWMDKSKKAGGLLFLELDAYTSKQIREWLGRPSKIDVVFHRNKEYPLHGRAAQEAPDARAEGQAEARHEDANPQFCKVASALRVEAGEARPFQSRATPVLPSLLPDLSWQLQDSQRSRGRLARSITTGFLIGVIVLIPVVLFKKFRPNVGDSLIHLGEKLNGITNSQPQSSSSPAGTAQPPAQALPTVEPAPNTPQQETAENPGAAPDASSQDNVATPGPVISGAKGTADHSSDNRIPHSTQGRSAEATRLWFAVGAGDASAEVELARLYLKGDGVIRNCEQARILLRAAARSGSWEARQQLQELRTNGCL